MVEASFHMPEYVYALHDFHPEHEDEVSFSAGERIEVLEKDDLYEDGWWQGRNLSGKVGLFPQSYTAPMPPSADQVLRPKTPLQSLPEESETEAVAATTSDAVSAPSQVIHTNGHAPNHISEPPTINGASEEAPVRHARDSTGDGEMMRATMTDVQKAIEQLGRAKSDPDGDGSRSFSFASSRIGDRDTETETDTDYELDGEGHMAGGEDWHKNARMKLAEKARRAVEEAEKLEMMMNSRQTMAPPIEVEVSDESEVEDDEQNRGHNHVGRFDVERRHSYILEEDEGQEEDEVDGPKANISLEKDNDTSPLRAQEILTVPVQDELDLPTATAVNTSFATSIPTPPATAPRANHEPARPEEIQTSNLIKEPKRPLSPLSPSSGGATHAFPKSQYELKHDSVGSFVQAPPQVATPQSAEPDTREKKPRPSEWNVDEVVEWVKSKGFGQDVCDKFIEQEITGDVLLELNVGLLKSEIGIGAFGKRMRIANAIAELRRPPSVAYSDHAPPSHSPLHAHSNPPSVGPNTASPGHSRNQSQAHSQSYAYTHGHSQSIQSTGHISLNSPLTPASMMYYALSAESAPHTGDIPGSPFGVNLVVNGASEERETGGENKSVAGGSLAEAVERAVVGLGIALPAERTPGDKNRPAQLMLSPSDSALHKTVRAVGSRDGDEDDAILSESELPHAASSMRQRLFGRSQDSPSSKEKRSSDPSSKTSSRTATTQPTSLSPNFSPTKEGSKDSDGPASLRPSRVRKSSENGKSGERLSLFGTTFPTSLGKSRKPAPKYQSAGDSSRLERSSNSAISRLYGGSARSDMSPTGKDSPNEHNAKEGEKESSTEKDPALLRKRTASMPGPLKPGQSIHDQIGDADYSGWMRKKGDRYNNWKLRYFVLKGHHLYCLRSNSKTETKIKGHINVAGYKVVADENANPGRYAFKIVHDTERAHFFSSDEKTVVREWMKAIMKATIGRDYSRPVMSSCNIPTIPLTVAQAMNPSPRPPSPSARDATQRALRRENPNELSSRDARVLMGLPSPSGELKESERLRLESFFTSQTVSDTNELEAAREAIATAASPTTAPPRPPRERRTVEPPKQPQQAQPTVADVGLIEWANSHLPSSLQMKDPAGTLCGGLGLLRLAESIRGKSSTPPVPDSAFPTGPNDDKLEGLFRLFDFLLDNDVKMGAVSINDVRQGRRDKILQILRALRVWEDKRKAFGKGAATWN